MASIPSDRRFDSTWGFLRDPYRFISQRCDDLHADVIESRLLLQRTILMRGLEATKLFYDPDKFVRKGAAPRAVQKTLFGMGGIQGLDDDAHRHRKELFLTVVTRERVAALNSKFTEWWEVYAGRWQDKKPFALYGELQKLLCRTVSDWAGVPLPEGDLEMRTRQLASLYDQAGSVGPQHLRSRWARNRCDRWIASVIRSHRTGRLNLPADSPAHLIAHHRDIDGHLLSEHTAAVELINILRPTIAVSVYILFVALTLHNHPRYRAFALESERNRFYFAEEVRRYYPFFPATAARVRDDFEWNGLSFHKGRRVMLDLYGTNHDSRIFEEPYEFRPERFAEKTYDLFSPIPQGGGDRRITHRCPGEDITLTLMSTALLMLQRGMTYEVPEQNLNIDFRRLPALPHSRFMVRGVKVVDHLAARERAGLHLEPR
jgi:fatty-acid peroxygenase